LAYTILQTKFEITNKLIVKAPSSTTRGHNQKLLKTRASLEPGRNFFRHRAINKWDDLSQKVVASDTDHLVNTFKRTYDHPNRIKKAGSTNNFY